VLRVLIVLRLMRLLCLMGISDLILTWVLVLIGVSRGLRLILIRILTGIIHRLSGNIIIIVPMMTVRSLMTIFMTDLAPVMSKSTSVADTTATASIKISAAAATATMASANVNVPISTIEILIVHARVR